MIASVKNNQTNLAKYLGIRWSRGKNKQFIARIKFLNDHLLCYRNKPTFSTHHHLILKPVFKLIC